MKAAETRRKDKVRWHSLPPTSSTMYRSVSAPSGDVEVTERVVVKAYGNVAPPHNLYPSSSGMMTVLPVQQSSSSSSSSSSSQVVPINNSSSSPGGGLPDSSSGRDGGSARKRPGRKTRRPDGYGSSPDAYGNGFPTSLQFGDSREGGCKIQAEQMGKEAPLRGTNNYASLLSSPSPSSIPNPSFKTKLSFDAVSPKLPTAAAVSVVSQPLMRFEGNTVQQVSTPPSPRQPEFLPHSSDVKYVEAAFSPLLASSMPLTTSTRFEVTSPESSSPTGAAYPMEDSTGNDSSEAEVSTPPATDFMTRFEAMYVSEPTFDTAVPQDVRSTASSNGHVSNPSSAVSTSTSERPGYSNGHGTGRETKSSAAGPRNRLESSSAIGIPKAKVKQAIIKSNKATNDYADPRRHGVPNMGPRQPAAEKGARRSSPTVSSGVSVVHSQCAADPQSHWKPVTPVLAKESPVLNGEGLLECPHSWPGPGLSLLGSPIGSLGKPGTECVVNEQGGVGNGKSSGQSKIFSEHWSPREVSQAMEAGQVFKATLRVNSHNRHEAYVTVDGVPLDILIDGLPAQNRAMEGDIVAVAIEPRSSWPRLKGSVNKQANPETVVLGDCGSRSEGSKDGGGETGEEVFPQKCASLQADTGRVQSECPERKIEDLGGNGWMSRVEEKVTEIRQQSFVRKDCNKIFSAVHDEAHSQKSKGVNHNNGRVADQRVAVTRSTVYQILKRPTSENTAAPALPQNGMEKGEPIKVPTAVGLGSLVAEDVSKGPTNVDISDTKVAAATESLASLISTCPGKRPTAKVVAILEKSHRREAVVGFLEMPQQRAGNRPSGRGQQDESPQRRRSVVTMLLMPVDSRCPKMLVPPSGLPSDILQRVKDGDSSIGTELVAARVDGWRVDSFLPTASVVKSLGQGGEIEPQLKAILFEHNAHAPDFPQASLDCLPKTPWKIPASEMKKRMDFRGHRIFSIDPPTARDLDDALSIERLWNGVLRVGVHIADVSYFINPGSALDKEAAQRSTSIYLEQRVLPMLPRLLCEELCSLNPGVDRLAFSVVWTISPSGEILEQWLGRSMIRSCAKLTYEHAQNMIDGVFLDMEGTEACDGLSKSGTGLPEIHGNHSWSDIVGDVQALHELAKKRRESRIEAGALKLNNSKIVFSLDEDGTPYDSAMYKTKDSNFVVEEFMLLANMTVAKVISNAFPDSALLRRHPEPNLRKLKEFEEFCGKNDFDLDTSSSGALRLSLEKMQDQVNHDPVLFNILMLFATKPMQLAKYFCTGELKDKEEEWGHYALACPLYTHFTSPIRRYPDVLVHRMLAAALDAEEILSKYEASSNKRNKNCAVSVGRNQLASHCFSSAKSERVVSDAPGVQHALALAASKHRIPASSDLVGIAAHCNERKLASRNVKEASDKLYLWAMLKKKGGLLSDARVLALGPKFMSLYICKIAMERRIYYEEIEGVNAEWFEATGTLVLDISSAKKTMPPRRPQGRSGRQPRTVADIAMVVNPADSLGSSPEQDSYDDIIREVEDRLAGKDFPYDSSTTYDIEELSNDAEVEPTVLPLTLRLFSAVPVSLHATGGDHRPLDIAVKLYVSSYAT